jgi:hypothetical protein
MRLDRCVNFTSSTQIVGFTTFAVVLPFAVPQKRLFSLHQVFGFDCPVRGSMTRVIW